MKKLSYPHHLSSIIQLVGIVINGVVGNNLEIIAHLIDSINGNCNTKVFIKKLIIILISQYLINSLLADYSFATDMTLWIFEKNLDFGIGLLEVFVIGNILNLFGSIVFAINTTNENFSYTDYHREEVENRREELELMQSST